MLTRAMVRCSFLVVLALAVAQFSFAADPTPGPPITIQRLAKPIVMDGDLSDWEGVTPVTVWFETRVGDNVEPQVRNEGYLAYDDQHLYAGFRFEDPAPKSVRAPIADHDQISGNTDYAGLIVDSSNDGKSATMFLANPNGLMYDAVTNDASGEDSAPDFYWETRGRITDTGWNLEIKVPLSSLRYSKDNSQTWGILLYRNYPRDRRYQFFSARLPRDVSCFICNSSKMTGLAGLPQNSHLVVAPYANGQRLDAPSAGPGSPLQSGDVDTEFGLDLKWSPLSSAAIDATINPDFSQIESDVAQISANERFALFYPEKRPFFLEGIDLFSTPIQAVYTRSVTEPTGGLRVTGSAGETKYTALGVQDEGGGLVILPGPQGSGFAEQDFKSNVGIFRMRRDFGQSFVSLLGNGRTIEHGGHNAVFGPDFQWRPNPQDAITGQALWSTSKTPDRADLNPEWDGRELDDYGLLLRGSHNTPTVDLFVQGQDYGPDFRADQGFVPQVGYREVYFEGGYTIRPKDRFLSRLRLFTANWYDADYDGNLLSQRLSVGAGMDGRWGSFIRFEADVDDIRVGNEVFQRFRPYFIVDMAPSRMVNRVWIEGFVGEEIDFANAREGTGATFNGGFTIRPGNHLELRANASARWLEVDDPFLGSGQLFFAQVERLRAAYSFNSRSFIRLIGQYVQTTRNASLYTFPVAEKDAGFSFSGLFAYKLNWQTVLYVGYGDERAYDAATDQLHASARQAFTKVSYALQR